MKGKYIIITLVLVIACDLLLGIVGDYFALHEPDANISHSAIKQSLFDKDAECLILGASRANHHYDSKIIEDSLGLTTYNAGVDGNSVFLSYVQLSEIMKRSNLKVVILDLSSGQIAGDWHPRFLDHKVYYGLCPSYTSLINDSLDFISRLKLSSNLYRYNQSILKMLESYLKGKTNSNGYVPLYGTTSNMSVEQSKIDFTLTDDYKKILNAIIELCRNNNVKLIAINSPHLVQNQKINDSLNIFFSEHTIPFFYYDNEEPFITDMSLFKDYAHMNNNGAEVFTKDVVGKIRNITEDCFTQN